MGFWSFCSSSIQISFVFSILLFSVAYADNPDSDLQLASELSDMPEGAVGNDPANQPQTILEAVIRQLKQNATTQPENNNFKDKKRAVKDVSSKNVTDISGSTGIKKHATKRAAEEYSINIIKESAKEAESLPNRVENQLEWATENSIVYQLSILVDEAVKENVAERLARAKKLEQQLVKQDEKKSSQKKGLGFTESEALTANFIMDNKPVSLNMSHRVNKSGWVYVGRFARSGWLNKTLDIKKSLPKVGRNYTVMQSLNMRSKPPTKKGSAELIRNLKRDDSVKILEVRQSGRNGHYWAEVEYQ